MSRGRPADQDATWTHFMAAVKDYVARPSPETFDQARAAWATWHRSYVQWFQEGDRDGGRSSP